MVSTRATPAPDVGPSGQHDTAVNDTHARLEAIRAQADLLEQETRLARAVQEARRLELANQTDPTGHSETFLGETLPQNVIAISNKLPGVYAQDTDDVRTGKLNFPNLIRLHPSVATIR
ncbi:hypothetical protein E4U37_002911 [Claviceps purpurea]|nr:hypothetical protein E4U37_002911 [Claviceps purpurea]